MALGGTVSGPQGNGNGGVVPVRDTDPNDCVVAQLLPTPSF